MSWLNVFRTVRESRETAQARERLRVVESDDARVDALYTRIVQKLRENNLGSDVNDALHHH